ncbi:putative WRKY family transcription factor [Quillaja saponaria]|uniref:WRKY family transcription factor n=1 Tax=Quillaja saponaria TaxID=32244 RepID=A0AAD7KTN8_QUISA|nr:putative WRKY family transcription factor [Quillaja saponaria]
MDEFTFFEDWDLQAIVRGSSYEGIPAVTMMEDIPQSIFSQFSSGTEQDDLLCSFPAMIEQTTTVLDELEELYKPFHPVLHGTLSTQTIVTSTISVPREAQESEKLLTFQDSAGAKCKRPSKKKKNNKRIVKQVTQNNLCSDTWAWRKYGQKPIKGSPYPRSYYRCSSSKGCSARKHVERSCSDPGVFIITYTSEHNHPDHNPTRRKNKLKLPTSPKRVKKAIENCSPNSKVIQNGGMKKEEDDQQLNKLLEDGHETRHVMPDTQMGLDAYEWFPSIEELDGLLNQEVELASDFGSVDQIFGYFS